MISPISLLGLSILLLSGNTSAAVYKHVDESGKVYYSDVPTKAGEKPITPPPITTLKSTVSRPDSSSSSSSSDRGQSETRKSADTGASGYSELSISQPKNDEAVRANGGSFSLAVQLQPALNVKAGHQLISLVDGKKNQSSSSASVSVSNVDRGSHSVQVQVVDKSGNVLKSSAAITVHVLRYSQILGR